MTIPHRYVGCDICKHHLDLYDATAKRHWRIANDAAAIKTLAAELAATGAFLIMEATGGYDRSLRHTLAAAGVGFRRINPMMARRFAEARGARAKTDALDARMLADFGTLFRPAADPAPDAKRETLTALARRRDQLVAMRAAEKTRLKEAEDPAVKDSLLEMINLLDSRIRRLEHAIQARLKADADIAAQARLLQTAPGIGPVAATILIALMPELGRTSPKRIAALAGLAPYNRDSGRRQGSRACSGGRTRVRRALYMAALAAARTCPRMQRFYLRIVERTGAKKPALIAVARKLLTCLNAMIRDQKAWT